MQDKYRVNIASEEELNKKYMPYSLDNPKKFVYSTSV